MFEIHVEFCLPQWISLPRGSALEAIPRKNTLIPLGLIPLLQSCPLSRDFLNSPSDKECSMRLPSGIWEAATIPWTIDLSEADAVDLVDP